MERAQKCSQRRDLTYGQGQHYSQSQRYAQANDKAEVFHLDGKEEDTGDISMGLPSIQSTIEYGQEDLVFPI